jgi:putative hydroxymethylpyrimidine transport system substrate-binding protein
MRKRPNVIRVNKVGVPNYDELVVVVRQSTLAKNPAEIRRFLQAIGRGYESVRSDPSGAVDNLVKASPGLDRKLQLASVRATLPAFFPAGSTNPWGYQNQVQWNSYGQWMLRNHLISNPTAVANASTNEELAGQGF